MFVYENLMEFEAESLNFVIIIIIIIIMKKLDNDSVKILMKIIMI